MNSQQDNTNTSLRIGFAAIILLLLIVSAYSLYRVDQLTQRLVDVVEVNNKKIELAGDLHDAVSNRWITLRKIVATNDPFERDELLLYFYTTVRPFEEARDRLLALSLTLEEEASMQNLDTVSHKVQPYIRRFVEYLTTHGQAPTSPSLEDIKQKQDQVTAIVNQLAEHVKAEANQAVNEARDELDDTYIIMTSLTLTIILLSITIARIVSHYVNKKNRDLIDAMKVKTRFLANMSHEVRTPLTAIIGFAETLLDSRLSETERRSTVNTIIRNGAHLQHIVDEILDISKDEADRLEAHETMVFILELIAEIQTTFTMAAQKKGLLFEVNYQFPLPRQIKTDPVKLKQILYNLCNNAVKYTEKGNITFNISCNVNAQQMHFDVVDSGIGISETDIKQIFEPFVQVDTSSTRRFGGAGLGLHLSHRFAELLGGALSVDSNYGHGSCFTLSLPTGPLEPEMLVHEIDTQQLLSHYETEASNLDNLSGNILLAEDSKDNQLLFRTFMKDTQLKLTSVENGKQALSAAIQGQFDLILLDIQMPVMNGFEAMRQLRNKQWRGPIIALTANVLPEDCERYLNEGFDDYIGKPVSRQVFLEKIAPYLSTNNTANVQFIYSTLLDEGPEYLPAIEHFVQQAPQECESLQQLFTDERWPELRQQLHRLKGSGGGVGFPQVTELARRAEQLLKEEHYQQLPASLDKLIAVLQHLGISNPAMGNPGH